MKIFSSRPPAGVHVAGTNKGEEMVQRLGHEAGRAEKGKKGYRSARDSTSINADAAEPIDPRMPNMPPA
jgi:hypothetical protein